MHDESSDFAESTRGEVGGDCRAEFARDLMVGEPGGLHRDFAPVKEGTPLGVVGGEGSHLLCRTLFAETCLAGISRTLHPWIGSQDRCEHGLDALSACFL